MMVFLPATAHLGERALSCHVTIDRIFDGYVRKDKPHIFLDHISIAIDIIPKIKNESTEVNTSRIETNFEGFLRIQVS